MNIYENTEVKKSILNEGVITSDYFKSLISQPYLTLEGAYITYQLTPTKITLGTLAPDSEVVNPSSGDLYFNTSTKSGHIYAADPDNLGGIWNLLSKPLLEVLVDTGFTATWRPASTLKKSDNKLDILIEQEYLPINFKDSATLFVGFKDIVDGDKIVPCLGIPLNITETSRLVDREDNITLTIPINFQCGLINLGIDKNIEELTSLSLNTENLSETKNIKDMLSNYGSKSSPDSDLGAGRLLGTNLNY